MTQSENGRSISLAKRRSDAMRPRVLQLLVTLRIGGAERLALDILRLGKDAFSGVIAGLFYPPDSLARAAEAQALPWLAVRADQGGRMRAVWRLSRLIRSERVSLVHAQAAYVLPYALPAARLAGIPIVYTEHAVHSLRTIAWLRNFVRLSAPWLQGISCVSEPIRAYFTDELGIAEHRVRCIPNGVDPDAFSPEGDPAPSPWTTLSGEYDVEGHGERPFIFGNVGRLCEAKDHETLLRAFEKVRRARPEARLLLVGDGELRDAIASRIRELSLEPYVQVTGVRSDIPELLRGMDVFVLSSVREGMPVALLEAMTCGLPCVSTDVGDVASLNRDEERLLLVPPSDPGALAQAMLRMMERPSERSALAERGMRHARAACGSGKMVEEYLAMYRQGGMR